MTVVGGTAPALAAYPTRTRTPTGVPPTATVTPTQIAGAVCSPLEATITAPFMFDGLIGDHCYRISDLGAINSFNMGSVLVN